MWWRSIEVTSIEELMSRLDPLLRPLATTLNRILALDPGSAGRLARLEGKSLAVRITAPEITVHVLFADTTLRLLGTPPTTEHKPDATVSGSPLALLALARDPHGAGESVQFSGDLGVVRDLRSLLAETDLDWEELLAGVMGDMPAHQLGRAAGHFRHWLDDARRAAETGVVEYLTEERRELPTKAEVDLFLSGVDRLREDADRLEARLRRLQAAVGSQPSEDE